MISNNHSSLAVRGGRANNSLLIARRMTWNIFKVKKKFLSLISSTHWKTYTRQWSESIYLEKKCWSCYHKIMVITRHNTKWFQWLQEQCFYLFFPWRLANKELPDILMEHANHDKHRIKTSSGTSSTRGDKILNLWLNWIALENTKLLSIHFTHEERIVEMIAL